QTSAPILPVRSHEDSDNEQYRRCDIRSRLVYASNTKLSYLRERTKQIGRRGYQKVRRMDGYKCREPLRKNRLAESKEVVQVGPKDDGSHHIRTQCWKQQSLQTFAPSRRGQPRDGDRRSAKRCCGSEKLWER